MAYSTVADVRLVLDATGDPADQESPNPTDDDSFTDAITQADGEVDLYLSARYTVPVTSSSPAAEPVRTWSRVIAAYNIYMSWHKGQPIDPNDPMRLRYARVIGLLQAVAAGTFDVPGLTVTTVTGSFAAAVNQYQGNFWPNSILQPVRSYPYPEGTWGMDEWP